MRTFSLSTLKAGITRLRDKGGASPDTLFDLLNGYVDDSGCPTSRDGTTVDLRLPAGTKGLCAFQGKFHVFAMTNIDPGSDRYVVDILVHPDPNFDGTLVSFLFAKPFLGFLYVSAEFSDGAVYHYWLQSKAAWQAGTIYLASDTVRPTVPNGFVYRPTTSSNPATWAPSTAYVVGDTVQPSTYNGYAYQVVEADGDNPTSGTVEPTWPTAEGALVYEDVDNTPAAAPPSPTNTSPVGDRYDNFPGSKVVAE